MFYCSSRESCSICGLYFLAVLPIKKSDYQDSLLYLKKNKTKQMKHPPKNKITQNKTPKIKMIKHRTKQTRRKPTSLHCSSHPAFPGDTLALGATLNVVEALFQKALCVMQTRLAASKQTSLSKKTQLAFFLFPGKGTGRTQVQGKADCV